MVGGLAIIAFTPGDKPALAALGVAVTAVGMLLVAPVGTIALAAVGAVAPVAIRLAVRDLARYRARSGGAVAAVSLADAIAAAISVSAGAAQVAANASAGGGALPDNQIVLWLGRDGALGPIPALSPEAQAAAQGAVDGIASTLDARSTLALDAPVDPQGNGGTHVGDTASAGTATHDPVELGIAHPTNVDGHPGTSFYGTESVPVYVATPEVLSRYGIPAGSIAGNTDMVTSRATLDGYQLIPIKADSWVPTWSTSTCPR